MLHQGVSLSGFFLLLCCCFLILCGGIRAAVPSPRSGQPLAELGLYNASDKVNILTGSNFKSVIQQNRSSLVEFYNSYCGHCKRFAPAYKKLAENLFAWRDVVKVCAIDCAAEENNEICREYEIMAYPTLRYFGLDYQPSAENYGRPVETQDIDNIRTTLAEWVASENLTKSATNWPNFQFLSNKESANIFADLESKILYVVVIYEPENSTIGREAILDFQQYPTINVRRANDLDVAGKFQIDGVHNKIAIVDRTQSAVPYAPQNDTSKDYKDIIVNALKSLDVTEKPFSSFDNATVLKDEVVVAHQTDADGILKEVLANKHLVYQADLEQAVRTTIFNEIPKVANISGERLLALQRYLTILKRYNPLGESGKAFIVSLFKYVNEHNEKLSGKEFADEVKRLDEQYQPIFSSNKFVGCVASKPGLRGFTCSLWQLFHYLTVQAAADEESQDPLEVLQAVHGYVKNFFGCSECAQHFQEMATRRKIWSTPNKDEAILWLWAAHNEVNQRLAGDSTEDPAFPKIQFPSQSSCSTCREQQQPGNHSTTADWNTDAVLKFLKNIHNMEYISRFGVENESLLRPAMEKMRQKRMVGNVFSEMDMRMGMLLYGFCILMMIVAFKLFAYKGYRKRPYGHEFLGKA